MQSAHVQGAALNERRAEQHFYMLLLSSEGQTRHAAHLACLICCCKAGIQCQNCLHAYVQPWYIEGLKHDFCGTLPVLRSVHWWFC